MPTMTLTVTTITSAHALWTTSSGSLTSVLASDDGTTSSGSSYAICSSDARAINDIAMSDPTVAEGDIASITSVRFLGVGRMPLRGTTGTDIDIEFDTPHGFSETLNFFNNVNYEVEYGTTRTTAPDGSDWKYSEIEDLKFNITKIYIQPQKKLS